MKAIFGFLQHYLFQFVNLIGCTRILANNNEIESKMTHSTIYEQYMMLIYEFSFVS
jgi:hypothetical protein